MLFIECIIKMRGASKYWRQLLDWEYHVTSLDHTALGKGSAIASAEKSWIIHLRIVLILPQSFPASIILGRYGKVRFYLAGQAVIH